MPVCPALDLALVVYHLAKKETRSTQERPLRFVQSLDPLRFFCY